MSENVVEKVRKDWVDSGKLQAMSLIQVEEGIHQLGKGAGMSSTSLASGPQQGLEPLTFGEVGAKSIGEGKAPLTLSPGRQRRGKREFLDEKVLLGPGSPNEKAKLLGVSHMTVRRAIKELKEEEGTHESLGQG